MQIYKKKLSFIASSDAALITIPGDWMFINTSFFKDIIKKHSNHKNQMTLLIWFNRIDWKDPVELT